MEKLIVGTDGSDSAQEAVAKAADLAKSAGSELIVVHAYEELKPGGTPQLGAEEEVAHAQVGEAILQGVEKRHGKDVSLSTENRPGEPADVLVDVADETDADLIVVGNKGMTGAKRFLLGSVPNRVSHHAPCSVLIIHTT